MDGHIPLSWTRESWVLTPIERGGSELSRAEMPRAFKKDGYVVRRLSRLRSISHVNLSVLLPVCQWPPSTIPERPLPFTLSSHSQITPTSSARRPGAGDACYAGLPCKRCARAAGVLSSALMSRIGKGTSLRYFFFPSQKQKPRSNLHLTLFPRKNRTCPTLPSISPLLSSPLLRFVK